MSLTLKIAKNTSALAFGKIVSTGLGILTLAILLRYLSPDDYGRYTTVLAFILLFGTFVDFGLNLTTTQDISEPKRDVAKTISTVFSFRILINIGLLLLLPVVLFFFPYDSDIKNAILITGILFFTQSLFQVLASFFQKELLAGKIAIAEMGGRIILLMATLMAVGLNFAFVPLMATVALSGLVQLWILLRFAASRIKIRLSIDKETMKRIMGKTWPIAASIVFTTIYFKGDAIILSLVRPYADVGVYGAAYKILEVLITLPILFMGLVLPRLSEAYAKKEGNNFSRFIQKSWDGLSLVALPMAAGILVLADKIIFLVAGQGYEPAGEVLRILILATAVIFLGSLFTHAIVAVGEQKAMVKYYFLAAVVAVCLYVVYIPTYSYLAAAWVTVLAEVLIAAIAFIKVRKKSHFRISFNVFNKALLASILMAGVIYIFSEWNVILLSVLGAIIYLMLVFVLRAMPSELRNRLFKKN